MSNSLLGVTVISPGYEQLGSEAVRRFKEATGAPVKIITVEEDTLGYWAKLELDRHLPACRCVFFDADWWALRTLDFSHWDGTQWLAVADPGVHHPAAFPMADCAQWQLDPATYWNSGFFAWHNGRKEHRAVFQAARRWRIKLSKPGLKATDDPGDQFYFNLAANRLQLPLALLPSAFNFMLHMVRGGCLPYIPRAVVGLHAAGVPMKAKRRHLKAGAAFLTYPEEPMKPGAALAATAALFAA